jgi:thiol:disulfide interchange protein DsbD
MRATSLAAVLLFTVAAAPGQDIRPQDVIQWVGDTARVEADGTMLVGLRMTAKEDWSVYSMNLTIAGPSGWEVVDTTAPKSESIDDPISGEKVDVYKGGDFLVRLKGPEAWGPALFPMTVKFVGCTKVICLFPYTQHLNLPVVRQDNPANKSAATIAPAPTETPPPTDVNPNATFENRLAALFKGGSSLWILFGAVFVGGLLSNLTPCVYPMIPITLRVLAKQGSTPYLGAGMYALGIVITYSALGIVAAASGGMFGAMLASKAFNVTFAVIMAALGVTMLGFGNLSKLQMLGSRLGAGKPSLGNAMLMGTGAGLVAAPCTGPILAALLAYTANSGAGMLQSSMLMVVYSLGFALPYIALGGAAAKVSQVKVPPHVQVGTKLLFAAVMFALSLYYLRIPAYALLADLKPYWGQLAAAGLTIGLVLSAVWVIIPSLNNAKVSMILPTTVLAVGVFAGSQWATSGISAESAAIEVVVHKTEEPGFAVAKAEGKPILIDMWAEWCEACKKMDVTTFADPRVRQLLASRWVMIKLDLTEDNEYSQGVQTKYALQGLPTLVMMNSDADLTTRKMLTAAQTADELLSELERFAPSKPKAE